jgi:cobalt-zinc-cadmium efflux system outer membrane protein
MPPPLALDVTIENVAGNGHLRGFDAAETTASVSRVMELGGKRARRRALGEAEALRASHGLASARLDLRILTVRRFVEVVADQERLALALEREEVAARTHTEVARVVTGARNPETDLRAAEISLMDAELEREHAEHELRAARVTLAATWGSRDADFDSANMALFTLPGIEPVEALAARLPASAELQAATLDSDIAGLRERLAAGGAMPDVNLSLGVRRLQAFGDHGLVMGFTVPLGTMSRARLALAETRALAIATDRRRAAVESEHFQQLYERYQELGHARTEFEALERTMIPKAEQALVLAQRGFDVGRFSFLTLAHAQQSLFELRRRRLEAAYRYHLIHADLSRLVAAAEAS